MAKIECSCYLYDIASFFLDADLHRRNWRGSRAVFIWWDNASFAADLECEQQASGFSQITFLQGISAEFIFMFIRLFISSIAMSSSTFLHSCAQSV